jgi:hypothetical protein
MNRGEADKHKAEAFVKILEGEVMLLRETIEESMHWNEPSGVRAAICRIRNKAEQIAKALDVPLTEHESKSST